MNTPPKPPSGPAHDLDQPGIPPRDAHDLPDRAAAGTTAKTAGQRRASVARYNSAYRELARQFARSNHALKQLQARLLKHANGDRHHA